MELDVHPEMEDQQAHELTVTLLSQDVESLETIAADAFNGDVDGCLRQLIYLGLAVFEQGRLQRTTESCRVDDERADLAARLIRLNGQLSSYAFENFELRRDVKRLNLIVTGLRAENAQFQATIQELRSQLTERRATEEK